MMTNKEAQETLRVIDLALAGNPNIAEKERDRYAEALDVAIEVLDRWIPKKPIFEMNPHEEYFCPVCGWTVQRKSNFCKACGQLQDWSDEK